ncbi:hypothetical protein P43SY_006747 [Pythium insidiosum]|uniref:Uncharacterized protein n=1 Tax=Pythium insidiosum TaxID=114742 RepID=A0AAD5LTR0_PYTIN|nr:hypothetical protein P43SY_006747 [Pythium insidiosum]
MRMTAMTLPTARSSARPLASVACDETSALQRVRWPRGDRVRVRLALAVLATLLSFIVLPTTAASEDRPLRAGTEVPRPTCRLFVDATASASRFVLVQGFDDDENVVVLDDFPIISPGLGDLVPADAYQRLRPGFLNIATYLLEKQAHPARVEPRHCHTHLLVTGELLTRQSRDQLDALFHRIHQDSIEDANFPFLFARDDLRGIDAMSKGYFQMVGANFLDLRIAPMIGPGSVELNGVLALQDESLTVVFDIQERWRRGVRRKQMSRALNTSDFYIYNHADFAQPALHVAVASTLEAEV